MEVKMAKRHKMSGRGSRRSFSKNASYTHRKNINVSSGVRKVMRGGIRL